MIAVTSIPTPGSARAAHFTIPHRMGRKQSGMPRLPGRQRGGRASRWLRRVLVHIRARRDARGRLDALDLLSITGLPASKNGRKPNGANRMTAADRQRLTWQPNLLRASQAGAPPAPACQIVSTQQTDLAGETGAVAAWIMDDMSGRKLTGLLRSSHSACCNGTSGPATCS